MLYNHSTLQTFKRKHHKPKISMAPMPMISVCKLLTATVIKQIQNELISGAEFAAAWLCNPKSCWSVMTGLKKIKQHETRKKTAIVYLIIRRKEPPVFSWQCCDNALAGADVLSRCQKASELQQKCFDIWLTFRLMACCDTLSVPSIWKSHNSFFPQIQFQISASEQQSYGVCVLCGCTCAQLRVLTDPRLN